MWQVGFILSFTGWMVALFMWRESVKDVRQCEHKLDSVRGLNIADLIRQGCNIERTEAAGLRLMADLLRHGAEPSEIAIELDDLARQKLESAARRMEQIA